MARRLVERGVRFVQIFMAGQPWDTHTNNAAGDRSCCEQTDLPVAGLLTDLQAARLLDYDAGRSGAASSAGRRAPRRQATAATIIRTASASGWPAAASRAARPTARPTTSATARSPTARSAADLHATILHLLGLDHATLTFAHNGRDERLTDVYKARIIKELLA